MKFETKSYKKHQNWYSYLYPDEKSKQERIAIWKCSDTINAWMHRRLYSRLDAIACKDSKWLTVGDGNGADAAYLQQKGCDVIASDISGDMLKIAKQEGLIQKYSVENAENISFSDNSFDYVLCKESFHHFPRPWIAFYEMLRVASKGIVLLEPHDPGIKMPLLVAACNIIDRINPILMQKIWKNRYSYETVGNFVFKISEREIEKAAIGTGMPAVAFNGFNDHYIKGVENAIAQRGEPLFARIKQHLWLKNILTGLHLMPYGVMCAMVFKQKPENKLIGILKSQKFRFVEFPPNPYLNETNQ